MPYSHHSHSGRFCAHAQPTTSPSSMLQVALSKGFHSYHLSEHVPRSSSSHLYPEEVAAKIGPWELRNRFEEYLLEARQCQKELSGRGSGSGNGNGNGNGEKEKEKRLTSILVGAETELVDGREVDGLAFLIQVLEGQSDDEFESEKYVKDGRGSQVGQGRVDYLVGSIHHVYSIPIDFDRPTFENALQSFADSTRTAFLSNDHSDELKGKERLLAHLRLILAYLQALLLLMDQLRPEVIGHFDLCRLFQRDTPMSLSSIPEEKEVKELLTQVDKAVRRDVAFACSYGALFELNSASVRKGWDSPYPGKDVLQIIMDLGGRLCLSDDAHAHEQVGLNYHVTRSYLQSMNLQELWVLEKDEGIGSHWSEEDERDRIIRQNTSNPGIEAPTQFARGTRAIKVSHWNEDQNWKNFSM